MNKLSVTTVPNPKLSEVTNKVTSFDNDLKNQVCLMRDFLSTADGIGLAANQIGYENQVIIVEFVDPDEKISIPFQAFINPEIVESSNDSDCIDEGCLSVPKIELPIDRSTKIKIRAQDLNGKKFKLTAKDLLARIIQHEIDHLNGIVFTTRIKEKLLSEYPELKKIKIVFTGSGDFGAVILEGLILLGLNPLIITEIAKRAGRKGELKETSVSRVAKKFGKKSYETENIFKLKDMIKNSDLLICADFGQKIPPEILKEIKIASINIHPSLLPKYRGATPIQTAILQGDKVTGVTVIEMAEKIDQGPIVAQIQTEINSDDNSLSLEGRLATLGLKLLFAVLPKLVRHELKPVSQNKKTATITHKFIKDDGEIDWRKTPVEIERQIRAFYPWPGSFTYVNNQRLIIHQAHIEKNKLVLDVVQKEGGKPIKGTEFIRNLQGEKPNWIKLLGDGDFNKNLI